MDARDARILARLLRHGRTPLRLIAEESGISVAAVHKRIVALEESGVIQRYRCLIHPALFGARAVEIEGPCERSPTVALADELGECPDVFEVVIASRDHAYVTCVVREDRDIREIVRRANTTLGITSPTVRTHDLGAPRLAALKPLDSGVAYALSTKARRPVSEIAKALGTSDKAVAQSLESLIDGGSLIFTIDLGTGATSDQFTQLDLRTDGDASPSDELAAAIGAESQVLWMTRFAGEPQLLRAWTWSPNAGALQELRERLLARPRVTAATPSMLLFSRGYPVWIHDALRAAAGREYRS